MAADETVGAVLLSAKADGAGAFDGADHERLEALAPLAAHALGNARLKSQARRGEDITLILEISREIGSTLDLDRVLRSVVNLASKALTFERGAVGLYDKGKCEIRAVAGQDTVDQKDPGLQDLIARAGWAAGRGETLYLSDRDEPTSDAERMFLTIFGPDLEEAATVSSAGSTLPLKDEKASSASSSSSPAPLTSLTEQPERGLLMILANQTAVALRNAQLSRPGCRWWMPSVRSPPGRRRLMALPRRRVGMVVGITLAVVAGPDPDPLAVPRGGGVAPTFRPMALAPVRALVPGVIERILVSRGNPGVARLGARDAESHHPGDRPRGDRRRGRDGRAAGVPGQREGRRRRRATPAGTGGRTPSRNGHPGRPVGAHHAARSGLRGRAHAPCGRRAGTWLEEGDLVLTLGHTDTLELEFGVDQPGTSRGCDGARRSAFAWMPCRSAR